MPERITIVGGGLAGLTLGIALRQQGAPVTVWESGHYPRHRVCGEFISGRGQTTLARLGLLNGIRSAGTGTALSTAFFIGKAKVATHPLPQAALCISRFVLDEWLANEFLRLGGQLHTGTRYTGKFGPGIVRAVGRRPEPVVENWRWFGLKVHVSGVAPDADLEMHLLKGGYVGLCRLPGDQVNVCGLFRSATTIPDLGTRWREWLGGPTHSALHMRMTGAHFDESSFCSVAGLNLSSQRAVGRHDWCVGDALTMIPPMTGNGMSMAFESAELAVHPLLKFSHGELAWEHAQQEYARKCDQTFGPRLRWGAWLQWAMLLPPARTVLSLFAKHSETCWRGIFERTR